MYENIIKLFRHCAETECIECAVAGCRGPQVFLTEAADVIEKLSKPNNKVHLCSSCEYTYPECPCGPEDAIFGNSIGNDNICACSKYIPKVSNKVFGTWEWDPDGIDWGIGAWKCSNCGSKAETWWAKDGNSNPLKFAGSHYCGNCGATMRK